MLALLFVFGAASILHATEARLRGGKIEFAVAKVNGIVCWTTQERDALGDSFAKISTMTVTMEDLTPTPLEVQLSTGGLTYSNFSDFMSARDDKAALEAKLDDLPPSKQKALKPTVDVLRSEDAKR